MSAPGEFSIVDGVPKPILAKALEAAAFELLELARKEYTDRAERLVAYVRAPEGYTNRYPTLERLAQLRTALECAAQAYADEVERFADIARQVQDLRGEDEAPNDGAAS